MHAAAASAFTDLARPLALDVDAQGRLATAWRYSLREVADHLLFIRQHVVTIAQRDEMLTATIRRHSPKFVGYARQQLAYRLPLYLAALRRVSEYETKMDLHGVVYARSSNAWESDMDMMTETGPHPDTDLIALGDELRKAWDDERAAFASADIASIGNSTPEIDSAHDRCADLARQMVERPPVTLDGVKAMAMVWGWLHYQSCRLDSYDGGEVGNHLDERASHAVMTFLLKVAPTNGAR